MRLFPGDDVPDLTAFSQEMPSPWLMPRGFSRHHRDRLGGLLARAIRVFDPRVRCIQLRWVEAPYVRDGRIKLPERVLVWWRSDSVIDDAARVLHEAPKILYGLHLLDLDGDPGVEALGWLAPLKVRLLHKLTSALLESGIDIDPEPMIDALNDAAARLVSPIDLLDFTERLVEARTSGLKPEEARVEAIAFVLAGRMAPGPMNKKGVEQLEAALERAAHPGLLPPDIHSLLLGRGLAENDPNARPPVLDWLAVPGVIERTLRRLQMQAITSARSTARAKSQREALVMSPEREGTDAPRSKATRESLQSLEVRAEEVLDAVRQGGDRSWSASKRGEAAALLQTFVNKLARARGDLLAAPMVEREAAVLEVAAQLWEDAAQPEAAANAWLNAAELLLAGDQRARALKNAHRAFELAEKTANKHLQVQALEKWANVSVWNDDFAGGQRAYDLALILYRELSDRRGESNALKGMGFLALRNGDLAFAERCYSEALTTYRAIGEHLGEANTRQALGDLYVRTARLAEAEAAYGEALTTYRAVGDRLGEANTRQALGDLYVRTARLAEAEAAYGEALTTYRAVGNRRSEANTRRALGDLYVRTARLAEAEAAYAEALTTFRAVGERMGEANTLIRTGALAMRKGDFVGAKKAYDTVAHISRSVGERLGEANALRGLAVVDLLEGREATEALQASDSLAILAHDQHGALLSRTFLAVADPTPGAVAELDGLAASFSSLGLPWEASLARAMARLKAGDTAAAASLLREHPETSLLAQEISQATPEEAIKLLLPYLPIA